MSERDIIKASCAVLQTGDAVLKADYARCVAAGWQRGDISCSATNVTYPPDRPSRPDRPELQSPGKMPRRRLGSVHGRQALLHAIAHIELNAIDLAFDMIARFSGDLPDQQRSDFISDWISVGDDEARHFMMIQERLVQLDSHYGALPAHDGLWEAAEATSDDILARLSVAPLVLEARGLDVTPGMIRNLTSVGDLESATLLQTIYDEEVGHVAIGAKWLKTLARQQGQDPATCFRHYVSSRFKGTLKEPFNHDARQLAGLERHFYTNIIH
ncbi:ferritin-like domain-containing protein [Parvularcula sp. IMCC14364]|uniref:ferritin-like domain-containing protein n=1 Tax=Parvularcula sp. IMCC14364 TaxID=3067902 RepID=UPI00274144A5|nr:ferritin-like domain-containing protein [Parvularcula sp. IMCC14364]